MRVVRTCLALVAALSLSADSLIKETERQRAPSFEQQDAEGNRVRIADYKGKVVLINFWATWCVPCKEEIPWLIEFERKYKDEGFVVIGISRDETGWSVAKPYMQKMGMNYRVVISDAKTAYKYGAKDSLPATYLVDKQGRVAAIHFGLVNRKKIEQEIKNLLQAPTD